MRRRLTAQGDDRDRGVTIIELIVSMGIFLTVLGIFMAGVVIMTHNAVRVQATADAGADVKKAFQRFDKQVRYADAINRPGNGASGARYVEFRTPATVSKSGVTVCTQWRWDPSTKLLQQRTWTDVTGTLGAFMTVAENVVLDATVTGYPFAMSEASPQHPRQELTVNLTVQGAEKRLVSSESTFIARNSTIDSDGNDDLDGNGVSDHPACWKTGVRP